MQNNVVPTALAPHVTECLRCPSLTLLTSVLDTPVNWLVSRFVVAALQGNNTATSKSEIDGASTDASYVILVSIWRSYELWSDLLRKDGLDIKQVTATKKLVYIDGLTSSHDLKSTPPDHIALKSVTLPDLEAAISQAEQVFHTSTSREDTTVVIDGIDALIAMSLSLNAVQVLAYVTDLQSRVRNLIVTCSADSALLHNIEPGSTPLEVENSTLVRSLAYQSDWVFACRPLETGAARDVSGIIRVSRGGADSGNDEEDDSLLQDGEWLYQVKGDGSVRAWTR